MPHGHCGHIGADAVRLRARRSRPESLGAHPSCDRWSPPATWLVVGLAAAVNTICWLTGWPVADTGNPAIDTYFPFAVAGSVCLMVCYLLVEIAAMWFVGRRGSRRCTVGWGRRRVAAAALGAVFIVAVLWFSVRDSTTWLAPRSSGCIGAQ